MKKVFKRFVGDAPLFLVAMMSVLFFTQCRKHKDENKPDGGITTSYLVGKKWQTKAMTVTPGFDDGQGGTITDLYAIMPACVKDNFTIFKADGSAVEDEGADKCPGTNQTRTYTWKLKDDGTLEGFTMEDFTGTFKSVKNSDTKVTITATGKMADDNTVRTLTIVIEAI
ncbi:MAG: hypothetical protein J7623_21470 [Chitinophaga sp.]|uniref:hypothetical protein n=1 Tax=Chitinophaga sp. TaxID=1869181 RepID=UPI001B0F7193|nr:hypothetical protein [Chitinophaga sp.]MBO9731223.1 hypothetical protein [Chitinophaga sp.]